MYCANASDGIFTAHPTHKGEQLKDVVGKKGYPLGKEIMEKATEGKVSEVASPRLRQATRKAHFLHEDWRPNLRRRLLQVGSTSPASTHSSQHQVPQPSGKKPQGCAWDAQGQSLHCTVAPASHQPSRGHGDGTMAATPEGPSRSARRLVVRNFLTFGLGLGYLLNVLNPSEYGVSVIKIFDAKSAACGLRMLDAQDQPITNDVYAIETTLANLGTIAFDHSRIRRPIEIGFPGGRVIETRIGAASDADVTHFATKTLQSADAVHLTQRCASCNYSLV